MRPDVAALVALGPFPHSDAATEEHAGARAELLRRVEPPVTDAEARALVALFGPDDLFGLAWTLLHLVETAPGWPLADCLAGDAGWAVLLRERAERGAGLPGGP